MKEKTEEQDNKEATEGSAKKTLLEKEEKSAWVKAAETIAGDNKLLGIVLKIVLSPLVLLVGVGVIVYCFVRIKTLKAEMEKLKSEHKKIADEKEEREEEFQKLKKKHKKLKSLLENETEVQNFGNTPTIHSSGEAIKKKVYTTAYLD